MGAEALDERVGLVAALAAGGLIALIMCWQLGDWLAHRGLRLPDPGRRIGHLDGLRGYLALFVVVNHYVQWTRVLALDHEWGTGAHQVVAIGQVPVAIFFMITGLLFYPVARRGFDETRWRPLLVSRVFRIVPLALLSVVVSAAILWLRAGFTADPAVLADTLVNMARWALFLGQPPLFGFADSFLVNGGVFWSLTSEWLFYLAVLPAIAAARSLTRGRVPAWATPLWMMGAALALRVVWPGQSDYMLPFMLGMMIAELREHPRLHAPFGRGDVALASFVVMVMAIAFLPPPIRDRTAMFYAPFLACVVYGGSFGRALASRGSVALGECSYGIYVLHGIVLWLGTGLFERFIMERPGLAAVMLLPGLMVVTVVAAAAAHVALERPMIGIGRKLARRVRAPGSVAAEPA